MRGDKCPFDHGPDPVVVENASAIEKLVGVGSGSASGGYASSSANPPPPGMEKSYGAGEGYNPEAPAITATNAPKIPNFSVPPPPLPGYIVRPIGSMGQVNVLGGPPPTHYPPPSFAAATAGGPPLNFSSGTAAYSTPPPPIAGMAMPGGQQQQGAMQPRFGGMRGGGIGGPIRSDSSGGHRFRPYGMGPGGVRPSLSATSPALCSLVVRKIPEEMNKIVVLDGESIK